jgi:predicted DNA binding CopG/RHH family protein
MADLKSKKGTKLSKAAVDKLASEAEAGYDLSKAKRQRVRPGRPSLGVGESPRITYRVAPALFERAKKKAASEGRTVSEVARDALQKYVAG